MRNELPRLVLTVSVGLVGVIAILSIADAGTFVIRVCDKDGMPVKGKEKLHLLITDSKGRKTTYTSTSAYFPENFEGKKEKISIDVGDCDDKAVTFEISRKDGAIKKKLGKLNGASVAEQMLDVIVAP